MIRSYRSGDEKSIARLEAVCFSEPWSETAIIESAAEGIYFFVYTENDNILGYVGIQAVADAGYITNVAVLPDYRKHGIALALMSRLDSLAEELSLDFISLEVRRSNTPAVSLYEKLGYKNEGVRKSFYRNPTEDAIIMTKRR